jgi:two-component system NtrC family sensor kinase
MADTLQIEQVLMNLATNARDAMPGEGTMTIKTRVASLDSHFVATHGYGTKGKFALLTVSDTGHGISNETAKHIFEPFFTTKDTGKGTGLGLSIAYGIIKTYGGYILCHSVPDEGATFSIYLPLAEESGDVVVLTQAIIAKENSEVILLVDENGDHYTQTRELLQEFGYKVLGAESSTLALEIFRRCRDTVDLVIVNNDMPGISEMEVYHGIREQSYDKRILVCKDFDSTPVERIQVSDSNLHFISKPFMPKELLMKIREVFEDGP